VSSHINVLPLSKSTTICVGDTSVSVAVIESHAVGMSSVQLTFNFRSAVLLKRIPRQRHKAPTITVAIRAALGRHKGCFQLSKNAGASGAHNMMAVATMPNAMERNTTSDGV
jgi:hypothetical protein